MESSPHNYSALLCALSVGAAIVIARPNDAPEQTATTEQQSIIEQKTAADSDSPSAWEKNRSKVKNIALKSYDFGKRITFKTATVSANFVENIGDSLAAIVQWRRVLHRH